MNFDALFHALSRSGPSSLFSSFSFRAGAQWERSRGADPPEVADVMAMLQSKGLLKRGPEAPEAAAEPSKKSKTAKAKATPTPQQVETRARSKRKPDAEAEAKKPDDEKPPKKGKPGKDQTKNNPEQEKPSKEPSKPTKEKKPSKEQPQEKPSKEQPQEKPSKEQSQEKPSKPGKQKKPSKDQSQDRPAEDAAGDEELGPFKEWPPSEPFGDEFFETGLNTVVSWKNLDNVWRACKVSQTPMYKDMQYEKLLQMMEMALGPRPKHVLKPVEVREVILLVRRGTRALCWRTNSSNKQRSKSSLRKKVRTRSKTTGREPKRPFPKYYFFTKALKALITLPKNPKHPT